MNSVLIIDNGKRFMRVLANLFAYAFIILYASQVNAKEYYVASDGKDWARGISPSNPWRTVKKVNSRYFKPGDVIHFRREDVWQEVLLLGSSGERGRPIVFTAYGTGEKPTIGEIHHKSWLGKADWNVIQNLRISGYRGHGVDIVDIEHLTIRNCYIFGCKKMGIIGYRNCHYLLVEDTEIYDTTEIGLRVVLSNHVTIRRVTTSYCGIRAAKINQDGIQTGSGQNVLVEYCVSHHNTKPSSSGIDVGGSKRHDATVRYNIVYENSATGISVANSLGNAYVYGNVIYKNQGEGIIVKSTANAKLYNNTVVNNGTFGLHLRTSGTVEVKNNIVHKNGETKGANVLWLAPGQTLISDYNIITGHSTNRTVYVIRRKKYSTFREWRSYGTGLYDSNSSNSDPYFVDEGKNNFSLKKTSPCINVGSNLGEPYNVALLPGSSWVNNIITADQNDFTGWEIGAYIFDPAVPQIFNRLKK